MRYADLLEARAWKHYVGRDRRCCLIRRNADDSGAAQRVEARVTCGETSTGRTRVHHGYFVKVVGPSGETWLGEHRHVLRGALREAERLLNEDGWTLLAVGLDPRWYETGLSGNSGYGYHPAHEGALHILEPWLSKDEKPS